MHLDTVGLDPVEDKGRRVAQRMHGGSFRKRLDFVYEVLAALWSNLHDL